MIRIERFRRLAAASITTAMLAAGVAAMPAAAGQDTDPYAEAVLATNPDLYWQFNDAPGATTVADSSGHGGVGTVVGGVRFGIDGLGFRGGAAEMDNLTGGVTAARNASDGKDLTIVFWYRGNAPENFFQDKELASVGWHTIALVTMHDPDPGDLWGPSGSLGPSSGNAWHMVTYVVRDGIGRLRRDAIRPGGIRNGVFVEDAVNPVTTPQGVPWTIGVAKPSLTRTPSRSLLFDEVSTYSRALSDAEIDTLYAAGSLGNVPEYIQTAQVGPLAAGKLVNTPSTVNPKWSNWYFGGEFGGLTGRFRIAQRPSGNGDYLSVSARVSAQGAYRAKAIVRPDGAVWLQLLRVVGANEQILGASELPVGTYSLLDTDLDVEFTLVPDARGVRLTGTWTVNGTSKELTVVDKATPLPSGSSNLTVYRSSAAVGTGSYEVWFASAK